jgi:hypothetical protein
MRTFFTKYGALAWIVLFLLILNISVISTIIYRNIRQSRIASGPPAIMHFDRPGPGVYLKDELGLSNEQLSRFMETRNNYQMNAMEMHRRINTLKRTYLHEMMQGNPNQAFMQNAIDSVGLMHQKLLLETGRYYDQIRQICRSDQVEKLDKFFLRIMQDEENAVIRGQGMQRGLRHAGRNLRQQRF